MNTLSSHRLPGTRALLCALPLLVGAAVAKADPLPTATPIPERAGAAGSAGVATDRAQDAAQHFKRGFQLFDDGDYVLALVEFERAYQLAPNYRALYNISLVCIQLGRYAEATGRLEAYLHDGGAAITTERQAAVAKTLAQLKLRTATIDISVNVPGAEVTLDGKPIEAARLKAAILIDAGEHTVRASAPGHLPRQRTLTLAGEDRASVRLDLPIVPEGETVVEPPQRTTNVFWPGFAAAGAFAVGAIVSGGVMLDARSKFTDLQNTPASDAGERERLASRANTAALVADVFTGLTVVAGGVSLVLSLSSSRSSRSTALAVSPQSIAIRSSF